VIIKGVVIHLKIGVAFSKLDFILVDYLRCQITVTLNTGAPLKFEMDSINSELNELQRKVEDLERENDRLRRRVEQYENANRDEM
ncbi:unnamed protein product, partial [Allacma fusca]